MRIKQSGKKKLQFVVDNHDRILAVLRVLHNLTDPDMFAHGYDLTKKKWSTAPSFGLGGVRARSRRPQ